MRARLSRLAVAGVLIGAVHGCNSPPAGPDGQVGGPERDAEAGVERDGPASDGPTGADLAVDVPTGADRREGVGEDRPSAADLPLDVAAGADRPAPDLAGGGGDATSGDAAPDTPASCTTQTVVLARAGTTSACSFEVSGTIPRERVNLSYAGRRLCRQGSNNCTSRGGWFWFGDEVALCDATCLSWEESKANLVLEVGCPTENCFVACRQEGGPCGDGINSCCVGWRCTGGACVACTRGGQACAANGDCCPGMTCQSGICVGPLGSPCASQAGCSQGECRDGRCQCAADQILCSGRCVSATDPNNCRGCGNVCGTGRVCTVSGCVCDPQSGLPDECNGRCVNKATDRTHCGACFNTCPRLEQVCLDGRCACPAGQTDCNGNCVDTSTSQSHCGMCNRACPAGVEVCSNGTCACAPGFTRCSGTCVNLQTNKYNCGACGVACPGNRTCTSGSCG